MTTLILLTWRKWWANNASKQQMGFNSAFKGLRALKWFQHLFLLVERKKILPIRIMTKLTSNLEKEIRMLPWQVQKEPPTVKNCLLCLWAMWLALLLLWIRKFALQYVLYSCWSPDIIINLKTEFHNLLQIFWNCAVSCFSFFNEFSLDMTKFVLDYAHKSFVTPTMQCFTTPSSFRLYVPTQNNPNLIPSTSLCSQPSSARFSLHNYCCSSWHLNNTNI